MKRVGQQNTLACPCYCWHVFSTLLSLTNEVGFSSFQNLDEANPESPATSSVARCRNDMNPGIAKQPNQTGCSMVAILCMVFLLAARIRQFSTSRRQESVSESRENKKQTPAQLYPRHLCPTGNLRHISETRSAMGVLGAHVN